MAGASSDPLIRRSACWALMLAWCVGGIAAAQGPALSPAGAMPAETAPQYVPPPPGAPGSAVPYRPATPENIGPPSAAAAPLPGETRVVDIVFDGMHSTRRNQLPKLGTRQNEIYDPQIVEDDVRKLMKSRKFIDVRADFQNTPAGVVVIFRIVERPIIQDIIVVGNQGVLSSTLIGKTDLKKGDGMDPYSIKEARDKLEAYYAEHGWDRARVTIIEGNKPGDRRAVFLIDEGRAQKIWWTKFVGNTIVTSGRLRTQIDTKPPIGWVFKGYADRKKIDEDVSKLTAYYRGLGFFQATVGRELDVDAKQTWVTPTFVINEGPRYKIRTVSCNGNDKIGTDKLTKDLKLTSGQWFNQGAMNHDLNIVRDLYGGKGYVFADIQPDPRLLEGQPEMDLIYNIKEGNRYRVGKININIQGDSTHTHSSTIYDRLAIYPGDVIDTRKLRSAERRLKASQIFATDPTKGPKITFSPANGDDPDKAIADRPDGRKRFGAMGGSSSSSPSSDNYRGQSPDASDGRDVFVSVNVDGTLLPGFDRRPDLDPMPVEAASPQRTASQDDDAWIDDDVWQRIAGQIQTTQVTPSNRQPIVRGQSPDAAQPNQTMVVRGQAPSGGWAMQPTDPDSMSRVARYQPDPTNPAGYPPTSYGPPTAAPQYTKPQYAQPAAYPAAGSTNANSGTYAAPPGQPNAYIAAPAYGAPPAAAPSADGYPRMAQLPGGGIAPEQVPAGPGQIVEGPQPYVNVEPSLPFDVYTNETQTGKLMVGVGVNSDAGLIGNIVIDEQNFDINRWPSSWEDFRDGTAFRGMGERFRVEASPGTVVQRYVISFQNPYLFDTPVSFSTSGSYFTRIYDNWSEARVGGRVGLGYFFTPDLAGNVGLRAENIRIYNPTVPTPPELEKVLGHNRAYGVSTGISHDTRDNGFLPTEGHLIRVNYEQVFGTYTYPQVTLEGRQYYKIAERPDGSGRHVLGLGSQIGFSGGNTPIYDEFFAGGFSTLRGFTFRGASPLDEGVEVGRNFEWLNSAEYIFPITADDVVRGVAFVDYGTVERDTEVKWRDYRIAPGLGLRISIPALGPAPIALDFAVPIHHAPGDREEIFSFFVGLAR
ncbi:MAG TPA: BamA/TamA family outer membrane protein [Pirellulales bacterium]|jgi:outer membrane protein insertion porin family|nr:BamA/TamA family outer membrane protein [Pirellulales bacterium]